MPREKVLLTVTTYPLPSRSYDELVCTAGIREDGTWVRIYPVPLSFLTGLKQSGQTRQTKYTWITLDLEKRADDFRPESYSPRHYDFRDLEVGDTLDTDHNWSKRKHYCLANVYDSLEKLIEDSKAPKNTSLATFKPKRIKNFIVEEDTEDWKPVWQGLQQQLSLFDDRPQEAKNAFPKVPYKFYYQFEDSEGKSSRLMIEDWEIGQLYWNCLRSSDNNKEKAIEKVRQKYEQDFIQQKDIYFFMGTTKQWHARRAKNPFVIIGVFYPKKEFQTSLF